MKFLHDEDNEKIYRKKQRRTRSNCFNLYINAENRRMWDFIHDIESTGKSASDPICKMVLKIIDERNKEPHVDINPPKPKPHSKPLHQNDLSPDEQEVSDMIASGKYNLIKGDDGEYTLTEVGG